MKKLFHHLLPATQEIAATQHYPTSSLYLLATPIGNLADISLRTLHVLQLADTIACEDTRTTRNLLQQYGITPRHMLAAHQHNEGTAAQQIIECLAQGQRVALVSDAGTPAISDPGAYTVQCVMQAGFRVIPLPGPSSVITALSVAGITHGAVLFYGFLPTKKQERLQTLTQLLATSYAIVLLEAPHRITQLSEELLETASERTITIARELTKQFEHIVTLPISSLHSWLETSPQKGEFVCVIHAPVMPITSELTLGLDEALQEALALLPTKAAASLISKLTGQSKNTLYQRALELKNISGKPSQMQNNANIKAK